MTRLALRKTEPSHAAAVRAGLAVSSLPQERWGGCLVGSGSSKKGPAARDGGSYKEER